MSENKRELWQLRQMQSLPLDMKIRLTEERIRGWYDNFDGQVYVAVSGGKDSQVLAHIVKRMYPDVKCVYVKTGLEYTSVDEKGRELADIVIRPDLSFIQVIEKYGYPLISKEVSQCIAECQTARAKGKEMPKYRMDRLNGVVKNADGSKSQFNIEKWKFLLDAPFRMSHLCCNATKKNPSKKFEHETDLKPILGIMAEESTLRTQKWLKVGCNGFNEKRPTSQPLSFWKEQDILEYIKKYELEIASIYGDIVYKDNDGMCYDEPLFNGSMKLQTTGVKRTGCIFCMFGITQTPDKFIKLKEQEPKLYDYVMRGGCFNEQGFWHPAKDENGVFGLGYKFVIDWLNEHGDLGIRY